MTIFTILALLACGRNSNDVPVRMVGVGNNPEEIGPSPTALGGVVSYDHVELAGGGLALAHMGLGSFAEVGPGTIGFAPPYSAVVGFSYLFDNKLPAASTLSFTIPVAPSTEDSCYTTFSPEGPIGSFTTLDVGDYIEFAAQDGSGRFRLARNPADYPADTSNVFIYYSSVEDFAPTPRTHLAPDPADPTNPAAMKPVVWREANFPFGAMADIGFPGGVSRFDQNVGSIPRPSRSIEGQQQIQLPDALGGVLIEWNGKKYDARGRVIADEGAQTTCMEFYGGGRAAPPTDPTACETPPTYPRDAEASPADDDGRCVDSFGYVTFDEDDRGSCEGTTYDAFPGQVYPGPWATTDGKVTYKWNAKDHGDMVTLAFRFMAPINANDANFRVPLMPVDPSQPLGDGNQRAAGACEQDDAEYVLDPTLFDEDGKPLAPIQGDPFDKSIEVVCLLKDDGEFTIDNAIFADAMAYAQQHEIGGVTMFFGRGTTVEMDVPLAKDQRDQARDISPVRVSTNTARIGRLTWNVEGEE